MTAWVLRLMPFDSGLRLVGVERRVGVSVQMQAAVEEEQRAMYVHGPHRTRFALLVRLMKALHHSELLEAAQRPPEQG